MLPDHLTFLSEAAGALLTSDDPRTFLDTLYRKLSDLVKLEVCVHYSLAGDGAHLLLAACQGVPDEELPGLRQLALGQAVCGLVAQRRTRITVSNVQHRTDEMTAFIRRLGISAYVCHPLMARGTLMGTLSFGTRHATEFTEDVLALLNIVSHYVAAALERQQSEESLLAFDRRRRLYETTLSNTPDLVYVFDLNHRFSYANLVRSGCRSTG